MPKIPASVQPRDLTTQASQLAAGANVPAGGTQPGNYSALAYETAARQALVQKWQQFFQRPFGPNAPIAPRYGPDLQMGLPRQSQYPVGVNIRYVPRLDYGLTPFAQLINLTEAYDVAAVCKAIRIETMLAADWSIVANDKKQQNALQDECDFATDFWVRPDRINDYAAWITMLLDDLFTIDAPTLYPRLDRGGDLYALEVVDGSTIKPLLDDRGRTLAYQQIIWGYPLSDYKRPFTEEDKDFPTFSTNELIYHPRWVRARLPYGNPPSEWIILRINTALRKQSFDLRWFTDGNIPDYIGWPPEGLLNPDEVRKFQDWFNAVLAGNDAQRRGLFMLPWAANLQEMRPFSYDTQLDKFMMLVTCASFGVPLQEAGLSEGSNRATAEYMENMLHRRAFLPLGKWLKLLFDDITAQRLAPASVREARQKNTAVSRYGAPTRTARNPFAQIGWQWHGGEEEDTLMRAQSDQIYMTVMPGQAKAVVSPDEVRQMRFGDVVEGPAPESELPQITAPANGVPNNGGQPEKTDLPPGASVPSGVELANRTLTQKVANSGSKAVLSDKKKVTVRY